MYVCVCVYVSLLCACVGVCMCACAHEQTAGVGTYEVCLYVCVYTNTSMYACARTYAPMCASG